MICNSINESLTPFKTKLKTFKDRKGGPSKYIVDNKSEGEFFEVDFEKNVYQNKQNDTKCDFGVKTDTTVYYIELKGSGVKGGINQLLSTIQETGNCFSKVKDDGKEVLLVKKARLIVSKFPKPDLVRQSKEYKNLVKAVKFIDRKNDHLIIKQNIYTETI